MPFWKQIALTLALGAAGLMAAAVFAPGVLNSLGFGGTEEEGAAKPAQGGGGWGGGQGGARAATRSPPCPPAKAKSPTASAPLAMAKRCDRLPSLPKRRVG